MAHHLLRQSTILAPLMGSCKHVRHLDQRYSIMHSAHRQRLLGSNGSQYKHVMN
jgi:hypothetical protein